MTASLPLAHDSASVDGSSRPPRSIAVGTTDTPSLRGLLEDGIYLLFLLRDGNAPESLGTFSQRIDGFLADFERHARNFGKPDEAIEHAKYAFCSLLDEIILASEFAIREDWERMPLQLRLFGEHLAGEAFFERLETLRVDPPKNIEALEVFYTCLLLGFRGKYLLEGEEKLGYLIHRVGQDIRQVRGGKAEFAPHWKLPHRFPAYIRNELSIWLYFTLLVAVATAMFVAYGALLDNRLDDLFAL